MPALYEATNAMLLLKDRIIASAEDGEIPPDLDDAWEQAGETFVAKVESTACVVKNLLAEAAIHEAQADVFKQEAAVFAQKQQVLENAAKRLKDYIRFHMEKVGELKVKGERFTVRVQNNSMPTVTVDCDPHELPDEFQRVKVEADLQGLARRAKDGAELPAGVRATTGTHLRIQ